MRATDPGTAARLARGCACVALALAIPVAAPAYAAAAHTLHLQVEVAIAGSSNPALDADADRAAGSGEFTLRVPYALATERGGLAIDLHANTRTYSTRELERARDMGAALRWSTRAERSVTGASVRVGRRSLDDRLDAGTGVFDVTREREEGEVALDHVHSWTPTARAQASLRATRIRHERVDAGDDILDYDVLAAGIRFERDLAQALTSAVATGEVAKDDGPQRNAGHVVGIDLDATEYRPSAPGTRTRTLTAAASGRWQPTPTLVVQGQAGLSHQRTSAGAGPAGRADSAWIPGYDLTVRQALPTFDATLNLARALRPTAAGGLTRNTGVSLRLRQLTDHHRALYAAAAWTRIDAGGDGGGDASPGARRLAALEGTTLAVQAGVQWQLLPGTSADLSWRYARNDRGDGSAAHDHSAQLALVYRTERARW